MRNHLLLLFCMSMLSSFSSIAQDWQLLSFNITSQIGNNSCHSKGGNHRFDFNVTLPPNTTTTQGNDVYEETYQLVITNNEGTTVHGNDIENDFLIPKSFKDFGIASFGNFKAKYKESAGATIEFYITINGRYIQTRTYTDPATGNRITETLVDNVANFSSQNFVFNGPPPFENSPILVNGVPMTELNMSHLNPCQVYTLTSAAIGATSYQWDLPDQRWLVSDPATLTSSSIDISIDWSTVANIFWLNIGSNSRKIKLEAFQDCYSNRRTKSSSLLPNQFDARIEGDPICHNNSGTTTLSVPYLGSNATLNWTINSTELTLVSGQGTNSIEVQGNNYHRAYTQVILDVTSPCGNIQLVKNHWMGAPLPHSSTLVGVTTAQAGNVRTFEGSTANGSVTNYSWSIPSSGLQFQYCTDCWKLRGSGTTTNSNNEEEPFAHVQIGRNNGYIQALYQNACGNSAAIKYVNVQQGGPGGGLCCDAPDPKPLDPNPMVTISLDGQRTSYGFDIESEVLDITALDTEEGRIYPNPAVDMIHIEIAAKDWTEKGAEIVLYNLASGKRIQAITTVQNTSLDLSELPSGVYVVDVITEIKTLTEKVVIKH